MPKINMNEMPYPPNLLLRVGGEEEPGMWEPSAYLDEPSDRIGIRFARDGIDNMEEEDHITSLGWLIDEYIAERSSGGTCPAEYVLPLIKGLEDELARLKLLQLEYD